MYKCINESIDSVLLKCNFEKRFQNCHIRNKSREVKSLNYFYVYDFIYLAKIFQIVFTVYLIPIFSLFCFLVNFMLTIFLIREKKNLKNKIYFYLKLCVLFNGIFSLITSFRPFSICIFMNGSYCVNIYRTIAGQYFYIINSQFLLNLTKTLAYWSQISFTVCRFYNTTGYESFVLKFLNISPKKYLAILFTICILVNISVFFEYTVHEYTKISFGSDKFEREVNKYPFYNLRNDDSNSEINKYVRTTLTCLHLICMQ